MQTRASKASPALQAIGPEPLIPGTQLVKLVHDSLDDDKAEDVVTIDLKRKSTIADFMVIASGRSNRHVSAMAEHLCQRLKHAGLGGISVEGAARADWILIDGGDVIVHVFRPEVRAFYGLEKMWGLDLSRGAEAAERPTGSG